jgi:hypothetical protein
MSEVTEKIIRFGLNVLANLIAVAIYFQIARLVYTYIIDPGICTR